MVKQFVKKLQRTFLLTFKGLFFVALFAVFFGLFGLTERELWRASRTAAISMSTFAVAGICFIKIYGGFAIGIVETLVTAAGLSTWKDGVVFAILIVVLLLKPTGILGKKITEKV